MIYQTNKSGFIINKAKITKIQPYYRNILKDINQLYIDKLGDNLISIYIRGSVSVGRAKPGLIFLLLKFHSITHHFNISDPYFIYHIGNFLLISPNGI